MSTVVEFIDLLEEGLDDLVVFIEGRLEQLLLLLCGRRGCFPERIQPPALVCQVMEIHQPLL